MNRKPRVVVTGFGAISPLGNDWRSVRTKLLSCTNAVQKIQDWTTIQGLRTQVGCPAAPFELDKCRYNRKSLRSMGRVGVLGVRATEMALDDAGLADPTFLASGDIGIAYGSCSGTPSAIGDIAELVLHRTTRGMNANTYIRMMAHTAPVNIGIFFGIVAARKRGRPLDYTLVVLAGTGIVLIYSLFGGFRGVVLTGMAGSVLFDTLPEGGVVPAFWASQSTAQILLGVGLSLAAYVVVSLCTPPDTDRTDRFIQQAGLLRRHSS